MTLPPKTALSGTYFLLRPVSHNNCSVKRAEKILELMRMDDQTARGQQAVIGYLLFSGNPDDSGFHQRDAEEQGVLGVLYAESGRRKE